MTKGLSNRAAGQLVGCSHVAIAKAVKVGRLPTLSDGSIDRAELLKWNKDRSPPRGGNRAGVTTSVTGVTTSVTGPPAVEPDETPAQAVNRIIAATGVPAHDRAEAERIRANYDALLRQLEYDTKIGLVVLVADVAALVSAEYARVRTALLAIPAERAPQIHRLKTVTEVQEALHGMIVEALAGLIRDTA